MKKISLKNLLIIYSIFVFLIPVIIISLTSFAIAFYNTKDEIISKNSLLVRSSSQSVQQFLDDANNKLEIIADFSITTENLTDKDINFFINRITRYKNCYNSIAIYNKKGITVNTEPYDKNILGKDFSNNNFIKIPYETKNTYWSTIEINKKTLSPECIISTTIIKNEEVIGFVSINLNLVELINILKKYYNKETGILTVISDKNGNVILYPDINKTILLKNTKITEVKSGKYNIAEFEGKKNIVFYEKLNPDNWKVMMLQNYLLAFKNIDSIKLIIIIVLVLAFIITLISIILGIVIIFNPLIEISRITDKVAQGDHQIKFNDSIIKELNILSINFNKMIKKIFKRENEIIKSEVKYRNLVEDSLDYFFKISKEMKYVFLSPSIDKLLGCHSEYFLNNLPKFLPTNRINAKAKIIIKNVFNRKITSEFFLVNLIDFKGESKILEVQVTPLIQENNVLELQGIARDITTRFKIEQEVIYLKNYLYSVIESMPSVIITIDKNGYINQFNTAALKFLNKSQIDLYNKILWNVSDKFKDFEKYFKEVKQKNEPIEFREEIKENNDYETRYYNITLFPLNWEGIKGMVLRIDDVSNIEKVEIQLRQAQKLEIIGTMAGGLAHDFNNILGAILGTLTLIDYKTRNKKRIFIDFLKEDLNVIRDSSNKAVSIIQQLMTLSRKQSIDLEMVDLNNEINQVVNICKNIFPKQIQIIVNYNKDPAWIEASISQIDQMILNLLVNAKDAIVNSGLIAITLEKISTDQKFQKKFQKSESERFWLMTISDNGSGILEKYKDLIFDPFFTTKEKGKGTGLGLTMVYNIVKQHGGIIDYETEIGKGTSFFVYLPIKNIHGYFKKLEEAEEVLKGHGLVLIVEDEEYVRYTAKEILKECGYDIILAKNGEEGVKIFKENYKLINVVLLDMIMPLKSGKDVYIEMKKIDKNVKVVLTSGLKTDPRISETLNLGVKHFLLKPYTFTDLSNIIYKILNE